jgi:hypothetical protein
MDAETKAIVGAILYVSRKSGELVTNDPALTARAILHACVYWEENERALVTPELKDSAAWTAFEMKIMQLGRAVDFVMRKLDCWKGRGPVLDAAAVVAAEPRYRRGRQSFVAALGEHGDGAYGAELVPLLADLEMTGYVVKALHKGANAGYLDQVLSAAEGQRPWVQNAARAYAASLEGRSKRDGTSGAAPRRGQHQRLTPRSRRPPPP